MHKTGKSYVYEMDGIGKKMKVVFFSFAVSALGLMGVPGFAGFISKWSLTEAAVESGNPVAYIGIIALLISALLTAIYMLGVVSRAFFPKNGEVGEAALTAKDPSWLMCLPIVFCAVAVVVFGIFSEPLISFFKDIAAGLY